MTIKIDSKKMKIERIKKGMSIAALSQASGLSVSSVWKIENEFTAPTPSSAKKICQALNVDFDQLFMIVDEKGA
ncbi:MAG TPA: helix-turn-helix transcriptional regulator [Clostridia bacterium]|nr:helix-turn-helix transcriptional regulator [Clostridia bacterium]